MSWGQYCSGRLGVRRYVNAQSHKQNTGSVLIGVQTKDPSAIRLTRWLRELYTHPIPRSTGYFTLLWQINGGAGKQRGSNHIQKGIIGTCCNALHGQSKQIITAYMHELLGISAWLQLSMYSISASVWLGKVYEDLNMTLCDLLLDVSAGSTGTRQFIFSSPC